jgi:hypothetical protein
MNSETEIHVKQTLKQTNVNKCISTKLSLYNFGFQGLDALYVGVPVVQQTLQLTSSG